MNRLLKPKNLDELTAQARAYLEKKCAEDEKLCRLEPKNSFDSEWVTRQMCAFSEKEDPEKLLQELDAVSDRTFVDCLNTYLVDKQLKGSDVYKAAHLDRRLFSKMMSDRNYKPSCDTAVAISIALNLTPDQVNDLLKRAGYTFSHSNKRDIVIEYFFRKRFYDLDDINEILYRLGQKIIGR